MMRMMRQSGKFEQFLKEMEKDGTLTSEMQMELARHYSSTGKSKEAIEIYTKAYDMTNSTGEKSQIAAQLMYEHVRLGDNDKSIEVYEKLIANASGRSSSTSYNSISGFRIESENDQVRGFLITAFQQNKKLNELVAIYETKLESKPEDPDILKLIAEIHRSAKRYVKAAEVYQSLIKIEPNSVQHYYLAAASLYKREQIDQANELIKQGQSVLSSSPRSKEMTFLLTLGSICYEGKMYEPAIALFEDALSISEVSALNNSNRWQSQNTYELLGQSYMRIKQYEKAVENYQYVKKIARNSYTRENADKAIKRAYDEGNLYEKQIPKQLEKVKQNPDDVNARITLAKSYVSSARFDEAIVQYEKIAELQPNSSKWHKTVGDLYEKVDKIDTTERYKKAAEAYQKAIALEPDSVDLSLTLAKLHEKNGDAVKAEEVYVRTFNIANNSSEQDTIVNAIIDLHNPKTLSKRLKILEDLQPKAMKSGLLNEALGYAYLGVGDNDKAEHYFREWLKTKLASGRNALGVKLERLAARLIEEHKLPVIAIEAARQFVQLRKTSKSYTTLGTAYMLNEQYDEAFKQFESSFNLLKRSSNFQSNQLDALLEQLSQAGKYIKDKTKFMELMGKVVGSIPKGIPMTLESNLQLAEFCLELKLHDKAHELMQKTGFFPETAWATLGPFDNTKGVGYSTAFIPEEESQIDKTAEYDGATSKIRWSKSTDETLDGFMEFGQDEQFYAAYAWISFTSPEEREAEIRFDSDDQGKVFLNGKKVYAHRRTRGATVDRRTIPITLVSGENTILVKVCNESLPWGFYLRITDTDGKPFDDLKVTDPE